MRGLAVGMALEGDRRFVANSGGIGELMDMGLNWKVIVSHMAAAFE